LKGNDLSNYDYYHDQGTMIYGNGDKYVGEFRGGIPDGQGTYTYASGEEYIGEFKDGKFNGRGTFIYGNGDKYVGEFRECREGKAQVLRLLVQSKPAR
jgi:hypothetical protein